MELQLKHLAPYLPYGLQLQYIVRDKVVRTGIMNSLSFNEYETHPERVSIELYDEEHIWMFKPLLKPMDEYFEELRLYFRMLPHTNWSYTTPIENVIKTPLSCSYEDIQWLIKNHYDVFGLINAGLATKIS